MLQNLGNKLKQLRLSNGLTREQVATLVGVSTSVIGLYETNVRVPSIPVLMKLSAHYKVSIDYLLDNNVNDKNTLSLEGLTDKQISALKATVDCFRNLPND